MVEMQMVQPPWKIVWQFLKKLNIFLPCDPEVIHFGIYPKELKTCVCTKTCTSMFAVALFVISKNLKQSQCSSIGE